MGVFEDLDILEIKTARESLPWPSANSDLRPLGKDWQHHALLAWQRGSSHGPISGYREGAEALAERMVDSRHEIDSLVYPYAYCWRHHIELLLKDLLADLQRL